MKRGYTCVQTTLQGLFITLSWLSSCFGVQPLAITVFSYRKVLKRMQEHNAVLVPAFQRQDGDTTVSRREIRLSRSLFADVFRFILCWIPSSIIFILTRFNFTETMFNSYAISLWISQIPSIPSSAQEWIPCSEEIFGESSSLGKTGRKLGTLNRHPRRMQHEDRIRFARIRNSPLS